MLSSGSRVAATRPRRAAFALRHDGSPQSRRHQAHRRQRQRDHERIHRPRRDIWRRHCDRHDPARPRRGRQRDDPLAGSWSGQFPTAFRLPMSRRRSIKVSSGSKSTCVGRRMDGSWERLQGSSQRTPLALSRNSTIVACGQTARGGLLCSAYKTTVRSSVRLRPRRTLKLVGCPGAVPDAGCAVKV